MCGRFTLSVELSTIIKVFQVHYKNESFVYSKRYNIAPSQSIPVISSTGDYREISLMRWGLIPHWAKDASMSSKLINARAETIDQKPAFCSMKCNSGQATVFILLKEIRTIWRINELATSASILVNAGYFISL